MMGIEINYISVLVSGVFMMVLGYLWYGPLFGKQWLKLVGIKKEEANMKGGEMAKTYGLMYISTIVLSYVFAYILAAFQVNSILMAVTAAFWTWLGFIATTMSGSVLFLKKPVKLYVIDSTYYLVGLIGVGIILTLLP